MGRKLVAALCAVVGIAVVSAIPVQQCTSSIVFVADDEDLCRYHWCTGLPDTVQMPCPPGTRVPTWFETSPNSDEVPCTQDHTGSYSCLRCDFGPDLIPQKVDFCLPNPCPSECICESHYDNHFCLCPGNFVPTFETVHRDTFFCDSQPCRNGAICRNQWDDYWCECPRGFTGKNCETPFCGPDVCFNGGTCTVDEINYHCECPRCYTGPCCETVLGNGRDCPDIPIGPPGVATPPPTPQPTPRPTPRPTARPSQPPIVCNNCQYGQNCEFVKTWLCDCNPCRGGQICFDRNDPYERECFGKPGPYGSQYTLTFSRDSGVGARFKRVYVNVGGMSLVGLHDVRIYTPNIRAGEPCYVDMTVTISLDNPAYYDVPANCLNTESGGVESRKVLKVLHLQGLEIVVTVSNMDGDGYLAIPDAMAGLHYVSHSYSDSGASQYITVVALDDNTQVLIQKPDEEVFNVGGVGVSTDPESNVISFNLNALDSVRYVQGDGNLLGSVIVSDKDIHVWTGNFDRVSQKTQEQLPTVNRWAGRSNEYIYVVVGISDGLINSRDEVHVETAIPANYVLFRVMVDGQKIEVARGSLGANTMTVLGELRQGEMLEVVTDVPVQITHNIVGEAGGFSFYSSYALIPALQQYAQSYSFQTHGSRDNVGGDYTTHYVTLVSPRGSVADGPSYFEDIVIYHFNPSTGVSTTYSPRDLGAQWVRVRDFYHGARIQLPAPGVYYLSNPSLENFAFGAVYYGVSGARRSQQPNTAFPLGYRLDQLNDIQPPVLCDRCLTGPRCDILITYTCACNPCDNFDDICTDGTSEAQPRTCESIVDTTGNPFTLMFMQNRPDNTAKRELEVYVTPSGQRGKVIRVYTPFLFPGDACYLNMEQSVGGFEVFPFNIPNPECYETIGSGTFNNKAIRVQSDDGDLLVYAVNRDEFSADGWVAFPDDAAGRDFFAVCHSPPVYGTEFAVLNFQDVSVRITLTYTSFGSPDIPGNTFILQPGEVLQIQSANDKSDLSGTRIQSDRPVNVYSGNIRAKVDVVEDPSVGNINTGSRDHLVEQLMPVSSWGRIFHIQPIPDRRFGDQVKVVGALDGTVCVMYRRDPSGRVTNEQFFVNQGGLFTRDVISDNTYRIECDRRVFVAQITKSQERGFNIHDPSLITVPPVIQYANRFLFNTPQFSGGTGSKRPYSHRLVLISAKDEDKDGIIIVHSTPLGNNIRTVSEMGIWTPVPNSDYYSIVAELDVGTSLIVHRRVGVQFMCIFYGYDDRESLGFPIRMKLQELNDQNMVTNFMQG